MRSDLVVDLPVTLDRTDDTALPQQLAQQIRALIGRGVLNPGDQLPSGRALAGELSVARGTVVTAAISGRPARGLENRFTAEFGAGEDAPGYPFTYDAGKALHQAAMARGEEGYAAWWAGQGAPLARAMPAAALVATLVREAGLEG